MDPAEDIMRQYRCDHGFPWIVCLGSNIGDPNPYPLRAFANDAHFHHSPHNHLPRIDAHKTVHRSEIVRVHAAFRSLLHPFTLALLIIFLHTLVNLKFYLIQYLRHCHQSLHAILPETLFPCCANHCLHGGTQRLCRRICVIELLGRVQDNQCLLHKNRVHSRRCCLNQSFFQRNFGQHILH